MPNCRYGCLVTDSLANVMPATLRVLIEDGTFDIRPLVIPDVSDLDRPLSWVHSSDLADPTPWLEPGNLLLTNGAQFTGDVDPETVRGYVEKLRALDVAGLGFATDIIHDRVPPLLIDMCVQHELPLVEVAARAPFIGIIRFVADILATERAARFSWLLDAQRAVARAAVRDDGLRGILRTLSQRLQTWVALYDALGGRVHVPGLEMVPAGVRAHVDREVQMLLDRGAPASLHIPAPDGATLQTIGQGGRLRGILAVGTREPLDLVEKDLVGTVVALASIALEQQRQLHASRRRIRTAVLEMLAAGQLTQARLAAEAIWGELPQPPFLVGSIEGAAGDASLFDDLDLMDAERLFFAERGDRVVLMVGEEAIGDLTPLAERRHLAVGLARQESWSDLERGIRAAVHAAAHANPGELARYDDVAQKGLIGALRGNGGELLSRTLLEPLERLPAAERQRLVESARVWLTANAAWDPASRELGLHRHTLRARMAQLGDLLTLDLSTFAARAELWAALEFADPESR